MLKGPEHVRNVRIASGQQRTGWKGEKQLEARDYLVFVKLGKPCAVCEGKT
jgi:hypothetical protein